MTHTGYQPIPDAAQLVACDVLEQAGHWPLGCQAQPLLFEQQPPNAIDGAVPRDTDGARRIDGFGCGYDGMADGNGCGYPDDSRNAAHEHGDGCGSSVTPVEGYAFTPETDGHEGDGICYYDGCFARMYPGRTIAAPAPRTPRRCPSTPRSRSR